MLVDPNTVISVAIKSTAAQYVYIYIHVDGYKSGVMGGVSRKKREMAELEQRSLGELLLRVPPLDIIVWRRRFDVTVSQRAPNADSDAKLLSWNCLRAAEIRARLI